MGVLPFGDNVSYGSDGNLNLAQPITGMASTSDGKGYWLMAADGGVFTFCDAGFFGSKGGTHAPAPIIGFARSADGYWLLGEDGSVYTFGNVGPLGSPVTSSTFDGVATSITVTTDGLG